MSRHKTVKIIDHQSGDLLLDSVRWCESWGCKFLGYQFRFSLSPGEALLMVHDKETIKGSSIHMFFVFTPLTVVWINNQGRVTHEVYARPWRPYYASPTPARYVLETSADFYGRFSVGDELEFVD